MAQLGGQAVYQTLKFAPSARIAALGGYQIAIEDRNLGLGLQNPASINKQMDEKMLFSHTNYMSDIAFGSLAYGHQIDSNYSLLGGFQYFNFGDFTRADEYGNELGTFSGGDYALSVGISRKLFENIQGGAAMRLLYSQLDDYKSVALVFDIGINYNKKYFKAALNIKNLGAQLMTYNGTREKMPLDIQLGISQKLADAPFRINITAHSLNTPDFTYLNTNIAQQIDFETGEPIEQKVPFSEKIARHFTVGGEILLSENFHLRIGYNHQRRKELALENLKGSVGYSMGFGLRVWRFNIDYAWVNYNLAGGSNNVTITSSLQKWRKKEKPEESTKTL